MKLTRRDWTKLALSALPAANLAAADWKKRPGLELWTVRDLLPKDYEGTFAKVAEIGYKEVEPVTSYGGMTPQQFRAMLDRYGLSAPSTHVPATEGPGLEKELEGFQVMGIRYTEIRPPARPRAAAGGARKAAKKQPGPAAARPAATEESIKRQAAQINEHGKLVKKFGMKMLVHNHTEEFQHFEGSAKCPYDILLAETDPELVAMQLDIGWATVAGRNVLDMFHKNPGRFELWHVKDARDIKYLPADMPESQRHRAVLLVPIGEGEVDYKPIFAAAGLAGLKHYCIEQDNAAAWGDSVAAARVSCQNLMKLLG